MNIESELQNIFDEVFEDKVIINRQTKKIDVEEWDSLVHILLVNEIESRFKIKISMDESMKIKTIGDLIDCISNKI